VRWSILAATALVLVGCGKPRKRFVPGPEAPAPASAETLSDGDRLFDEGRRDNGVPDDRASFVGWAPALPIDGRAWTKASYAYESDLRDAYDWRRAVRLGRTYGFLGSWSDAARVFADLFAREPILTASKRTLDPGVTKAKPELVAAYLDWGVCERRAYADDHDKERLLRCRDVIFTPLQYTLKPDTSPEVYWTSLHGLVRTLMDLGAREDALLCIEDAVRNVSPTFDDDEYGCRTLLDEALQELRRR
jgi:hypothetical protein